MGFLTERSLPGSLRKDNLNKDPREKQKECRGQSKGTKGIKQGRFSNSNVKFWIEKKKKGGRGRVFEDKSVRDVRALKKKENLCGIILFVIGILFVCKQAFSYPALSTQLTQDHMKEQPVKSPIAYRDTHSFKYSTTSSHHAGEVVTLMQCSDENKHACYFRDGKDTFHLLPPRNLLQPFISQKKQWA